MPPVPMPSRTRSFWCSPGCSHRHPLLVPESRAQQPQVPGGGDRRRRGPRSRVVGRHHRQQTRQGSHQGCPQGWPPYRRRPVALSPLLPPTGPAPSAPLDTAVAQVQSITKIPCQHLPPTAFPASQASPIAISTSTTMAIPPVPPGGSPMYCGAAVSWLISLPAS